MIRPSRSSPASTLRRSRRALGLGALAFGLFAALVIAPVESQAGEGFEVVVNAKNPLDSASRDVLTDLFLKRTTAWSNSEHALPVDLPPSSAVRRAFSQDVLRRSVAAVRTYWTQRIFSGSDVPPLEVDSEDAMLRFVASHPGAVGYRSPGAAFAGTKRLEVR